MATKKWWFARCPQCGFPRIISLLVRWNSNGTATQILRREYRLVFFPTEFLDGLFSNIEARLGIPIKHLAFEAQRNASKALFEGIPGGRLLTRLSPGKRLTVEGFNLLAMITGMSLSHTLEYVPHRIGVARITNPFQLELMAAQVVGAFEFLEECPFEYSWEKESSNNYVITVRPTPDKSDVAERLEMEFPPLLPGDLRYDRCPRCGVPRTLSHLEWVESEGIILDKRTGTRIMISDGHMVAAVFREMAKELGDEVNALVIDAQRDWTVQHVRQLSLNAGDEPLSNNELERAYRTYLADLPAYGQGNPVDLERLEPGIRVKVRNPYEKFVLAGTLQGLFEALEKTGSVVEYEEKTPGEVSYTVTPA